LAALAIPALAAPVPQWRLAGSEHFEVYAQSSDQRAQAILTWFEQLRAFFEQQRGLKASSSTPIRVIVFASADEYQPYRLRSTSDAYYVGAPGRDYIVMGTDDPAKFGLAAHEYAHLVLRTSASQLPPWLKEGLAEFFATLQLTEHGAELGGALPGRARYSIEPGYRSRMCSRSPRNPRRIKNVALRICFMPKAGLSPRCCCYRLSTP
jgi:hypothetical protein